MVSMKPVSTEELINHKILPYNIYSEFGEKLFSAGELLTPGKLLQLRHMNVLFRDDAAPEISAEPVAEVTAEVATVAKKAEQKNVEQPKMIVETFDMRPTTISRNKLSVDDIDIMNYRGPINKSARIDPQTQLKIKAFYTKIQEMMNEKPPMEMLGMYANIRDKIMQDIISESNEVFLSSQLKLLGEYNRCHALNTAILSGSVAKKMGMSENAIYDVVLAGLLHDIGKSTISPELLSKISLTSAEQKIIQDHTKEGYQIIKIKMQLPENIARVALDHHECNDGSGYPNGKSGDRINIETQIVNVCNYFDNLTSNRTSFKVRNTKEALKVMLSMGTQKFYAEALYTFIHMFSYNDTTNFEEMIM